MIEEGHYTLVDADGDYRTYRIRTATKGALEGSTIISKGKGDKYQGFAFLRDDDSFSIWKRFRPAPDLETDILTILDNPQSARMTFAMYEGRCSRCGRKLTVPASIHHGLGPECAGKGHWTKQDQKKAFTDT